MIYHYLTGLIQKAVEVELIEPSDTIYVRNQVMNLLNLESFPENVEALEDDSIPNLLEKIIGYAVDHCVIEDNFDDKEILTANIMNCFVARPSVVNGLFNEKYKQSPEAATSYFYILSKNSNYIQMNRIEKNIHFKADTAYGELDITINLSKPEKDPEQIKREKELKKDVEYPACVLCPENEGYAGRIGYPARANHRIVQVPLVGENWYLQYSPYVYYNEHSIVLAEEHRDMKINKAAFERLVTFTEKFPHYFIGSNADLPIVGGSILSHDHYQAGHYEFAMTNAADTFTFSLGKYNAVSASVLKWPLSVIRLKSNLKKELLQAGDHILQAWKMYSDPLADVKAFTGDTPHNTVTPIARLRDGLYELDLVLRNNRTSEEHPLGIFHPHADVHHIKKENIGLIEVMGLAVLPARLKEELHEIKQFLLESPCDVAAYHQDWASELKQNYGTLSDEKLVDEILKKELGNKFARVLEDASVFKDKAAFQRFIETLNE
ncbi:UDP-glucose--hexose-1-phosphate uridylyltransferase [Virgibacillus sp. C22-A2]|uniref:Galactose-1-phosphate uridylyltransferase n=1 Tax=Virgibacillus tibetensis TaxID=3042313 RepID=A0ABU6KDP2_9BACI|nr:UDP-glucose--hexose-1-phosphate uridylyltransferase [Virgibacillus sp. C22-A2]